MYFISVQSTLISIGFISKGAVFVGPICTVDTLITIEADLWPLASSNAGSLSMPSYAGVCVYVSI